MLLLIQTGSFGMQSNTKLNILQVLCWRQNTKKDSFQVSWQDLLSKLEAGTKARMTRCWWQNHLLPHPDSFMTFPPLLSTPSRSWVLSLPILSIGVCSLKDNPHGIRVLCPTWAENQKCLEYYIPAPTTDSYCQSIWILDARVIKAQLFCLRQENS